MRVEIPPGVVIEHFAVAGNGSNQLPAHVTAALGRGGAGSKSVCIALGPVTHGSYDPAAIDVAPDTLRMLRGEETRGGLYCYMAVHPISDRKKNTYLGIAANPAEELFRHNHGAYCVTNGYATAPRTEQQRRRLFVQRPRAVVAATRETRSAAPYWVLAAVVGPFHTMAMGRVVLEAWHYRTRGDDSKHRRAHAVSRQFGLEYFGRDVRPGPGEEDTIINEAFGGHASNQYAQLRDTAAELGNSRPVAPKLPRTGDYVPKKRSRRRRHDNGVTADTTGAADDTERRAMASMTTSLDYPTSDDADGESVESHFRRSTIHQFAETLREPSIRPPLVFVV